MKIFHGAGSYMRNLRTVGLVGRISLSGKVKTDFSDLISPRELKSIVADAFFKSSLKLLARHVTEINVEDIRFLREKSTPDTGAYCDEKITIESASIRISWLLGANDVKITLPIDHTFHVSWVISPEGPD